jgi:hypothetical protein
MPVEGERRVSVRFPCDAATTLQAESGGAQECLQATIRDVSRGGINLSVDRYFESGSLLSVETPAKEERSRFVVLAYVVHATEQKDGKWALGCTFARQLSEEDLKAFGAAPGRIDSADNRTSERYSCAVVGSYQIVTDDVPEYLPAKVLNISASGALLVVSQPIETGVLLSLKLSGPRGGPAQTILGCVVHRRLESDQEWTIGCNFIRELSELELDALL